jgi:hypothetical protein
VAEWRKRRRNDHGERRWIFVEKEKEERRGEFPVINVEFAVASSL